MNEDGTVKLIEEVDDTSDGDEDIDVDDIIDIRGNDVIDVVDEDASDGSSNPPRLIVGCTREPNTVTPPHQAFIKTKPPSYLLSNFQYMKLVVDNIRGTRRVEQDSINVKMKEDTDRLVKLLRRRLACHIRTKVQDPSKFNHPALLFVRENLNRFAAFLLYFDQARMNRITNSKSCLLKNPHHGGFLLATDATLKGSYLYYSTEEVI